MIGLHWDIPAFMDSLVMMLKGMVGIFVVIAVILCFVVILNRLKARKG